MQTPILPTSVDPKRWIWDQATKAMSAWPVLWFPVWWVGLLVPKCSLALSSAQQILSQEWLCHLLGSLVRHVVLLSAHTWGPNSKLTSQAYDCAPGTKKKKEDYLHAKILQIWSLWPNFITHFMELWQKSRNQATWGSQRLLCLLCWTDCDKPLKEHFQQASDLKYNHRQQLYMKNKAKS